MPPLSTRFTQLLEIDHPIVQDGMGPYVTDRLAAAVSNAGGLGTVSSPGREAEPSRGERELRSRIAHTASLTDRPFAVNVPVVRDPSGSISEISATYLRAVIAARKAGEPPKVLITSSGFPGELCEDIRDAGLIHLQKVGSTRQAVKAAAAGVDAVIASGYEMGGHIAPHPVHTMVLVPNVADAVDIPVLLSGGARDGRALAAALCLGASGVAMGTRFIATEDIEWHPAYAQAVLAAGEGDDLVTEGPARVLRNRAMERWSAARRDGSPYTAKYRGEKALFHAQRDGDVDEGIVSAGQVASGITELVTVQDLLPAMADEAARLLNRGLEGRPPVR
ncbi:NAD(P)H-dependent flavin oxidoreductase [Streptomyces luteolus]|uniref:Nitronate monooxygenase family protein n=1 Tax=Streptomyces luteolus TaxID=3043615 RepID=A0ABT6SPS6_9ACTN|nr:nitronate monooxygenase family protein [Streptomyces sp. B-S-A12]MDI3417614.1 nitronate monooxygenase family protein [Streptomyces sp. B-S-A12]